MIANEVEYQTTLSACQRLELGLARFLRESAPVEVDPLLIDAAHAALEGEISQLRQQLREYEGSRT